MIKGYSYHSDGKINLIYTVEKEEYLLMQLYPVGGGISQASENVKPNGDMHYHDTINNELKDKILSSATWDKLILAADGVDEPVLSGLPVPCVINVDGINYDVLDGSLEFTTIYPGEYVFILDHPHYMMERWALNAS